jgi:hypothetical protein
MKGFFISSLLTVFFSIPGFAQHSTIFPQFASGGGWSSELFVSNQGLSTVNKISVDFHDDNGLALSVNSTLGAGSTFSFDLPPGATQVIKVIPATALVTGYVIIQSPSGSPQIRATEVYRYEQNGMVLAVLGVPQQERGDHFSFPVEINSSRGITTAVSAVNAAVFDSIGQAQETLVFDLIRNDGTIQNTAKFNLKSGQHRAGYLDESWLFPGIDNFAGSLSVSSPGGVGVLALRQDQQAYGAISTDNGPILGPFALSSTAVKEVEPNDTPAKAQLISVSSIITGIIGTHDDVDLFQFAGKAGDIVTVIASASGSSNLDSYLEVYDRDLRLVAVNDQSGLSSGSYPLNDSFVHIVLPADGTYYIALSDYWFSGDPSYAYELQIKLP